MKDLRLASPGGHSQRLISPVGHLQVASLNDHRVSSDSEIRVHSPSKFIASLLVLAISVRFERDLSGREERLIARGDFPGAESGSMKELQVSPKLVKAQLIYCRGRNTS